MFDDLRGYYYSRYGLAEVLVSRFGAHSPEAARDVLRETSRDEMETALEERVQRLLQEIRVHFPNPEYPPKTEVEGTPVHDLDGSPGEQVGENGYVVRPHVLLQDGQLNGRYGFINSPLPGKEIIQRYYPPATKLSVGKASASNVKKTRLFALACTVTTLTPLKAARRTGSSDRGAVIPDLSLDRLVSYLDLYLDLQPSLPAATQAQTNDDGKPYLLQNRGTFPNPPPAWSFGTLGVVAGIGSWARENGFFDDAAPVLEALATCRAYIIDTSGNSRVETAGSHVVRLAREGILDSALNNAWKVTTNASEEDVQRLLRRWLLRFNPAYFKDFLSLRATYPPSFSPLIDAYFMPEYDDDLIASARTAAQHINSQAYHAADGTGDTKRQNKQTILSSLESMLYDCDSGPELIARISVQVGRLTGSDFPPEAQAFFDRTTAGELSLEEARNLLVAYMRLRGPAPDKDDADPSSEEDTASAASEQESPDPVSSGSEYTPDDELGQM